jgi:predicted nucleic acid-binding protein
VVDASVAAKWVLPGDDEPFREEALAVLHRFTEGEIAVLVPGLFWPELGNILWKATRSRRIDPAHATGALSAVQAFGFPTFASDDLIDDALQLAVATGRTVYDSTYVAAALRHNALFITADERLVNALGSRVPVRWLGSYLH